MTEKSNDTLDSDIVILDSYDSAKHRTIQEIKCSIVSFSSQLLTNNSKASILSTTKLLYMLIWQQMIGAEIDPNLLSILSPIYE